MSGERGHPANEQRQLALITGEPTYVGKRCKRCNCTTRYTKSGSCVDCTKGASADQRRRKTKTRRERKRRERLRAEADLGDILGLESTEREPARGLNTEIETTHAPEAIDESPKTGQSTPCTPRIAHGDDSNTPGDMQERPGINHQLQIGDSGGLGVLYDDPAAQSMAYAPRVSDSPNKSKTRYFCHPESGSIFTTAGEDPDSDGLVEEISEESYADLKAAGFTEPPESHGEVGGEGRIGTRVNDSDGLDDILG